MRLTCSSAAAGSYAADIVPPTLESCPAWCWVTSKSLWFARVSIGGTAARCSASFPKPSGTRSFRRTNLNRVRCGFNCYVIRTGEHSILIETGAGDKPDRKARERMGLPEDAAGSCRRSLRRKVSIPESIDIVINTHLHFDHCGGNTILSNGAARPAFPRARYYTRRGEWEHAHTSVTSATASATSTANYDPLVESGQMQLIDEDCEIAPGSRDEARARDTTAT